MIFLLKSKQTLVSYSTELRVQEEDFTREGGKHRVDGVGDFVGGRCWWCGLFYRILDLVGGGACVIGLNRLAIWGARLA